MAGSEGGSSAGARAASSEAEGEISSGAASSEAGKASSSEVAPSEAADEVAPSEAGEVAPSEAADEVASSEAGEMAPSKAGDMAPFLLRGGMAQERERESGPPSPDHAIASGITGFKRLFSPTVSSSLESILKTDLSRQNKAFKRRKIKPIARQQPFTAIRRLLDPFPSLSS
ncbi:hypothetical protein O6H91_Y259400 [Diphasiastrum complanatum]|nr:hypothetical protein O6H91_Y259400 [Diphasiastrum complanatum]